MNWKPLVSWNNKSNSGKDNRERNKTMAKEKVLEEKRQGES
jgi:hypothetical protein